VPPLLVEIGGEKPACLILKQRVDSQGVFAEYVVTNHFIGNRKVFAVATLRTRFMAKKGIPFVCACRRVAGLALPAFPSDRVHVFAATEQRKRAIFSSCEAVLFSAATDDGSDDSRHVAGRMRGVDGSDIRCFGEVSLSLGSTVAVLSEDAGRRANDSKRALRRRFSALRRSFSLRVW